MGANVDGSHFPGRNKVGFHSGILRSHEFSELGDAKLLKDGGREEGKHDLMMTNQGIALSTLESGSPDDIHRRPVMVDEVHIHRCDFLERVSQIPGEG